MEEWKDIRGYEGYYQVSNMGNVRSVDRVIAQRRKDNDILRNVKGQMLKQWNTVDYYHVTLSKDGKIFAPFTHKLVAEAFVDNPNGYKNVNHIDENKLNNKADNLEWCTQKYNRNYGTGEQRRVKSFIASVKDHRRKRKVVLQIDKDGNIVNRYFAMNQARFDGYNVGDICRCCKGELKTYRGYVWRYEKQT